MKPPLHSAIAIARLLSTEGFTDHVANMVEKYWLRNAGLTHRQARQIERLDDELTKLCQKLTEGEKRVLGRFIGLHKKMSFDTGLKIGITAFAKQHDKEVIGYGYEEARQAPASTKGQGDAEEPIGGTTAQAPEATSPTKTRTLVAKPKRRTR